MANRHAAYKEVMGELKDRIRGHTVSKFNRPKPIHKEPEGDESADGDEYPGSPDDMGKPENVSEEQEEEIKLKNFEECPTCGRNLDQQNKCSSCSYQEGDEGQA